MNDEIKNDELSLQDLFLIYETRMMEIARNANDIMKRRLSCEYVDKSETENQELLMKDLLRMEKAIKRINKMSGKKYDTGGSVDGTGSEENALGKVRRMESSIARIQQKIN